MFNLASNSFLSVAPFLREGRGLKRQKISQDAPVFVAPFLREGRGLKQMVGTELAALPSSALPSGRARIETNCPSSTRRTSPVAPFLREGRGLKQSGGVGIDLTRA